MIKPYQKLDVANGNGTDTNPTDNDERAAIPGSDQEVENPALMTSPEEKYVGEWEPGTNQPTLPADTDGPYAGIVRYLPMPESQIVR